MYLYKREEVPGRAYDGFAFIAQDLVLLPNALRKRLEILQLPDPAKTDESCGTVFKRVALLHLPEMNHRSSILRAACQTDYITSNEPRQISRNTGHSPLQGLRKCDFTADPSLAIVLVDFVVLADRDLHLASKIVNLIISRTALVDAVRSYCSSAKELGSKGVKEEIPVEIPWSRWSPDIARWCMDSQTQLRGMAISGQRCAGVPASGKIVVKDFNQYAVNFMSATLRNAGHLKGTELCLDGGARSRLIDSHYRSWENQVYLSRIFTEDICQTELPYVETTWNVSYGTGCHDVYINEEQVFRVQVSSFTICGAHIAQSLWHPCSAAWKRGPLTSSLFSLCKLFMYVGSTTWPTMQIRLEILYE